MQAEPGNDQNSLADQKADEYHNASHNDDSTMNVGGIEVTTKVAIKYLGLTLDCKLTF